MGVMVDTDGRLPRHLPWRLPWHLAWPQPRPRPASMASLPACMWAFLPCGVLLQAQLWLPSEPHCVSTSPTPCTFSPSSMTDTCSNAISNTDTTLSMLQLPVIAWQKFLGMPCCFLIERLLSLYVIACGCKHRYARKQACHCLARHCLPWAGLWPGMTCSLSTADMLQVHQDLSMLLPRLTDQQGCASCSCPHLLALAWLKTGSAHELGCSRKPQPLLLAPWLAIGLLQGK